VLRTQFERLPANVQGLPEYKHVATGIIFVRLPGGHFLMGSDDAERQWVVKEWWKDDPRDPERESDFAQLLLREQPQHNVTLSPFLIGKFEITQAQWRTVMGQDPAHHKGQDHPVENVSWFDCKEFCARSGLALLTEAQWEYACRAGTMGPYGGTGKMEEMGWCASDSVQDHQPVGGKNANHFGLHDMHGNVAEWVEDAMDEVFYSRAEATFLDPVCTSEPLDQRVIRSPETDDRAHSTRIARGGAAYYSPLECRSAVREPRVPNRKSEGLGCRVAFSLR
jgi:formylglycine-generating enzyme required for sulfatase activity